MRTASSISPMFGAVIVVGLFIAAGSIFLLRNVQSFPNDATSTSRDSASAESVTLPSFQSITLPSLQFQPLTNSSTGSAFVTASHSTSGSKPVSSSTSITITGSTTASLSSSSTTTSTATTALGLCGTGSQTTSINGSTYCMVDVSNDIVVGAPGYSYFLNESVNYLGIKFQTICPSSYQGCPKSTSSSTQMMIGAIKFNMTFPDHTQETAGQVIGDSVHVLILSNHVIPRAGLQIEYGPSRYDTVQSTSNYHVFLLVQASPLGA